MLYLTLEVYINIYDVIKFLEKHQPLPNDADIGENIIVFDESRKLLKELPNVQGLNLLLGAFGDGSGFGVYQLVVDTALEYPPDLVIPIIKKHLSSTFRSVRYWNVEVAASFPDDTLIDDLERILEEDLDMKYAAFIVLGRIKTKRSKEILSRQKEIETDKEIIDLITENISVSI